jgi:transketolase
MRRALSRFLLNAASKDDRIIFLTGDLGFEVFDEFKLEHPNKYINGGIAESNLVSVATGLASLGFRPIVYSIASFVTARPYEFIKILSSYNGFPITVIGAGGGLTYSSSGATHQALDDVGLMLMLPEVNVLVPSGPEELIACLEWAQESENPTYIRIGKFGEVDIRESRNKIVEFHEIAKGEKIVLLTYGAIAQTCLKACLEVNESFPNSVSIMHFVSLRPLNENNLVSRLSEFEKVFVVEEHWPCNSLYSLVIDLLQKKNIHISVVRIGPSHQHIQETLDSEAAASENGMSKEMIVNRLFQELC